MILKGGTSGAEAKITNVRLVTDFTSTVQGSFYIPNPNVNTNPVFQTGERDFLLTDDPEMIFLNQPPQVKISTLQVDQFKQFKKILFL